MLGSGGGGGGGEGDELVNGIRYGRVSAERGCVGVVGSHVCLWGFVSGICEMWGVFLKRECVDGSV